MGKRLSDLRRALGKFGIALENTRQGPHPWKAIGVSRVDGTRQRYGIPAHQGLRTEVRDPYLKGVAEKFGLDEDELREDMGCPRR